MWKATWELKKKEGEKRECGGQLKVFEKREMTVNGEGNGWTKKGETTGRTKKERGECLKSKFFLNAEGNP